MIPVWKMREEVIVWSLPPFFFPHESTSDIWVYKILEIVFLLWKLLLQSMREPHLLVLSLPMCSRFLLMMITLSSGNLILFNYSKKWLSTAVLSSAVLYCFCKSSLNMGNWPYVLHIIFVLCSIFLLVENSKLGEQFPEVE